MTDLNLRNSSHIQCRDRREGIQIGTFPTIFEIEGKDNK